MIIDFSGIEYVSRLTSVWTMLTRCVLINWTKLWTSMIPSCLACSRLTSTAIYVPVLPTPALEYNKQRTFIPEVIMHCTKPLPKSSFF